MLAIDWLGCLVSVGALALLFRGRWALRLLRAVACVALGQLGAAAAALVFGGQVTAITAGGLFTGVEAGGVASAPVTAAGLWVGAFLALPLGPRLRRDSFLYALLCSLAISLLS